MGKPAPRVAFVFGGGGVRGAVEIGMLQALLERGIRPDLVVGTSVGAMNAAAVALDPTPSVVETLMRTWSSSRANAIYGDGWLSQAGRAMRTWTHLNSPEPLRNLLEQVLGADLLFSDLTASLRVVAASIERAAEHVFDSGLVIPAVMASTAVPGLFPPAEVKGEHFIDGGVVNSIPIAPAVEAGASEIYVLQVGRVEKRLQNPRTPVETARVAFEISRRHRFARDVESCPATVRLHVLPSGGPLKGDDALSTYRNMSKVRPRIEKAYAATAEYLDSQ